MARDLFHQSVCVALIKDGWTITDDPFYLKSGGVNMEIDLAAEQVFAATKDAIKIVVEVKSFLSKSKLQDFYLAKGQYDVYKKGLERNAEHRILYLAIEEEVYNSFFQKTLIQEICKESAIFLLIFNHDTQTVVQWIN